MIVTKTLLVLSACALPCMLAGAVGCNFRSSVAKTPAAQESSSNTSPSPPVDATLVTPRDLTPAGNSSGIIQREKPRPENPRIAKFAELDANGDGALTLAEFSVGRTQQDATRWFGRRDADRDGSISLAEFAPKSAPLGDSQRPELNPGDKVSQPVELPGK